MIMTDDLLIRMMEYDAGDPKRIQHFLKVYGFARLIGTMENLDEETQYILETAAIVHDIGIKVSEQKYGNCSGTHQEEEGPAVAEAMLNDLGYPEHVVRRVCYLVGHHHTYHGIDGPDYQILVEADFLVNLYEDGAGKKEIETAGTRIFKTEAGKRLLSVMFAGASEQAD